MGVNRGKQFENSIREQFKQIENISVDRFYDVTMGYSNIDNPCDMLVFDNGTLNYFELKAIHGNTLNFKGHIRSNQWDKLLEKSNISKVNAGVICWFIDLDKTFYIDIKYLNDLQNNEMKSFNGKTERENKDKKVLLLEGKKKRILYEYNLKELLERLRYD